MPTYAKDECHEYKIVQRNHTGELMPLCSLVGFPKAFGWPLMKQNAEVEGA